MASASVPSSASAAPAVRHALGVLTLLSQHAGPMPAAAIARSLEVPRSSVYRILGVLVELGFVSHLEAERRYALGVAAFELGFAYSRQEPLGWVGRGVLARLVDATGHHGHLAVLHGRDVLYVVEERAAGRPSLVTEVGVRLPAHLTASGLAMLAALPAHQFRALYPAREVLVSRGGPGPRSVSALRALLREVRELGFAVEDASVTPGFASVACAVRDHGGHPVAAVALTFPSHGVDTAGRTRLAAPVSAAAAQVSRALGAGGAPASSASSASSPPAHFGNRPTPRAR
ncbi:MAG TPA: IclR family transcriptional regulator [Solirubrobacteraceae bacterium]|nr:IclR family transcriptional regulator [Solirubrobacteraceae bacterium]